MKQKMNWWLDLVLFITFIATYFLDFTGVEPHQWLGVVCSVLIFDHLLAHRDWLVAVSKRILMGSTFNKTLYFYVLDVALLTGLVLIVTTGLVISTWFNLTLDNFDAWLRAHVVISIGVLLILVLKLALHWRWIARLARKIWSQPDMAKRTLAQPQQVNSSRMGRREFLQVMSVVGIASALAFFNAYKSLTGAPGETLALDLADASIPGSTGSVKSFGSSSSSNSSGSSGNNSCTVQCRRRCSYPGHCRRYVDSNNNGLCDLGECL